jgi:glycerophosphoryl diester phosphodiesterase
LAKSEPSGTRPLIIAHRGHCAQAVENTLGAVRAALALPVDGIEIDVHLTADGVPVVMHDKKVDRTTDGSGPIRKLTLAQWRRLLARRDTLTPTPLKEGVPTLEEVLAETGGHRLLAIEIKPAGMEEETLDVIRRQRAEEWVWIWSFRRSVIRRFHKLAPEIPGAFLSVGFYEWPAERYFEEALSLGSIGISLYPEDVSPETVKLGHRMGLEIYSGTPNDPAEWERLRTAGLDAIITDDSPRLLEFWADRSPVAPRSLLGSRPATG